MGKVLATKVRDEYAAIIEHLAEKSGCTVSDIIGNFVQTIIRLADRAIRLTPYMKNLICKFEVQWGSKAPANIGILEQNKLEIQDAIYRVSQQGRQGKKMLMLERGMFNSRDHAVISSDRILNRVLETEYPTTFKTLQTVDGEETIDKISLLLSRHADEALEDQIAEMFMDADRAENGIAVSQQQKYKKKYHYDPDTEYDKRQKIQEADLFSSLADAEQEAEDAG